MSDLSQAMFEASGLTESGSDKHDFSITKYLGRAFVLEMGELAGPA
jgi:hypothetical protein